LTVAVLLLVGGVLASRAYGDGIAGTALAGFALPYAFAGGALLLGGTDPVAWYPRCSGWARRSCWSDAWRWCCSPRSARAVSPRRRVFMAGGLVGLLGAATALLSGLGAKGAAAVLMAALVCGIGLLPVLAIRFGKVPVPSITLPRDAESFAVATTATDPIRHADRSRVFAA
jgi:hypothetical protein